MNVFIMDGSIVKPFGRGVQNNLIGYAGEHGSRTFVIRTMDDISAYTTVSLLIDKMDCGVMTVTTMPDNSKMLSLTLSSAMIGKAGVKTCQIVMAGSNGLVQKSAQFEAYVGAANDVDQAAEDGATLIIISQAITDMVASAAEDIADAVQDVMDTIPADYSELSADVEELKGSLEDIINNGTTKTPNGFKYENQILYLTANDEVIGEGVEITSGSGGGQGNNAVITMTNTTGWLAATVSQPICALSINWSSYEDDNPTGDGMLTVRINNVQKISKSVSQGDVVVSIGAYLISGTNNVKLTISDVYGNARTINYTVNYYSYVLSSTFDRTQVFSSAITYYYVATGAGSKVMHFKVDGTEVGTEVVTSSGRQNNYLIGTLQNGSHTLEAYFTVTINDQSIESNHLFYDLIYADSNASGTIIASSYNTFTINQYSTCLIPFVVFYTDSTTADVTLAVGGTVVSTLTNLDRSEHYWSYKATTHGTISLSISSGGVTKTLVLTVNESDINIHAETQNLALYLSSSGRSNDEADPGSWEYGGYSASFTDFLYDTDGWQLDREGNTCLRTRGISRVVIPYQVFGTDFTASGKTIEFEFTTKDTIDPETAIISCYSGGIGFVVTPQKATLYSNLSSLSTVFKEDEHVRISFVINKAVDNRLVLIYINGIMSGCIQYSEIDSFQQLSPVGITIGSSDATIDLYTIRIYDNNLTRYQILDNWIADTQDVDEMLDRYNRNNIYDEYDEITISKLPSYLPYMVIYGSSLPGYKGDKKTVSIEFEDPTGVHPSFTAENVQIDVQGTSSAGYARKNFKCKFRNGFVINNSAVSGYQMTRDSIATSTFCFKADVASSEGANNVELVRLYNDYSPYQTEPQQSNSMVRQGIDGFPMVIFHNDGETTKFVGKYNFNNDKGTPEVYGFETGDESWEILNNTDALALFKSDDFTNWANSFEGRYPDENTVITNLQSFVTWVYSTDTSEATDDALTEAVTYDGTTYTTDSEAYRLAKFKNELSTYANVTALGYYYVFTELFLMIDSRAKNAFPSFFGDGKWLILPYDFDTAIGINNEGELAFGPFLEDTDTISGAHVFNGYDSVLWENFRTCFASQIKSIYNTMRNSGISYSEVESRFEEHQSKWSEAIFNEDAQYKYIDPLVNPTGGSQATSEYLPMLLGSKEQQRKWWLYNRFLYMDNRYEADSIALSSNRIYFRANAVANLTLTPAHDTYLVVKYGSAQVQEKAAKDVATTMTCPLSSMNDTECYVYGCENVKDLGDMVGLNVSNIALSQASNLQYLKLGDVTTENTKLTTLDLSSCNKLKVVDLRNCINLTGVIDVSNCYSLEELYLEGTQVTAVNLPKGGILKKLHLSEVSSLIVINQPYITDFDYDGDYSNINTLHIKNANGVPFTDIVQEMADRSRVKLEDVNLTFATYAAARPFFMKLYSMRGIDEYFSEITGAVTILSDCPAVARDLIQRFNPDTTALVVNGTGSSGILITACTAHGVGNISTFDRLGLTPTLVEPIEEMYLMCKDDYTVTGNETWHGTDGNTEGYIENNKLYILGTASVAMFWRNSLANMPMPNLNKIDLTYVEGVAAAGSVPYVANANNLDWIFANGMTISWVNYYAGQQTNVYINDSTPVGVYASYNYYENYMWALRRASQLAPVNKLDNYAFRCFMQSPVTEIDFEGVKFNMTSMKNCLASASVTTINNWELITNHPTNTGTAAFPTTLTSMVLKETSHIDADTDALSTLFKRPPLDLESITSVINALEQTETPITLTLNATTFSYLTPAVTALAAEKGYTLASA